MFSEQLASESHLLLADYCETFEVLIDAFFHLQIIQLKFLEQESIAKLVKKEKRGAAAPTSKKRDKEDGVFSSKEEDASNNFPTVILPSETIVSPPHP